MGPPDPEPLERLAQPPPAPAGGDAGPRHRRGEHWPPGAETSEWKVARVFSRKFNVFIGWGAECKLHFNEGEPDTMCKKQLTYGRGDMPDDEAKRRILGWLVAGSHIDFDDPACRTKHLKLDPRKAPLFSEPVLEERARAFWATRP